MKNKTWTRRAVVSLILLPNLLLSTTAIAAQDLVPTGSLGGGQSVFVFRSVSRTTVVRRIAPQTKPSRTETSRVETARKIKRQYETVARVQQADRRTKAVEPSRLNPSLPPAQASKVFAGVGEYYLAQNDYEKSFEFFEEAIKLDATNTDAKNGYAEALATKGNALLEQGKLPTAKSLFEEALTFNPANIAANFGLGEIYEGLDQLPEAIKAYERSLEVGKDLTEIYVPLGILYYRAGEIAKADDMLSKALVANPKSAETQYFLGLIRTSQNKLEDALAAFQQARTLDPDNGDAYFQAAETLVKLKRVTDAIPDYEKATQLKPNEFEAWLGLAQALLEAKKYPEAIAAFTKARRLKNNSWELNAGLAEAQRQTSQFEAAASTYNLAATFYVAEKDFDKEVAADLYSKAGFVLGQQCGVNQEQNIACPWPDAIGYLEKAVQLANNPLDQANLGWAYYNAARSHIDRGDRTGAQPLLNQARDVLQKAIAANPNQVVVDGALQNLGAVQNDLGDFAGAVQSLKNVAERHPEWTFSRYALATAYFKVNDFNNASKWFNIVLEKEPDFVPALSSLGATEIKRKNKAEVKRVIDRLKPLSPSEASKIEVQAKLAKVI